MFPLRLSLRIGRFPRCRKYPSAARITVDTITVTVANSGWAMNADTSILAQSTAQLQRILQRGGLAAAFRERHQRVRHHDCNRRR